MMMMMINHETMEMTDFSYLVGDLYLSLIWYCAEIFHTKFVWVLKNSTENIVSILESFSVMLTN